MSQDFERELQAERKRMQEMEADPNAPGWQQVEVMETQPVDLEEREERNIMDDEPVMDAGTWLGVYRSKIAQHTYICETM